VGRLRSQPRQTGWLYLIMETSFTLRKRPMDDKYAIFHDETGHRSTPWLASRAQVINQFNKEIGEPFKDHTNDEPATMESQELM